MDLHNLINSCRICLADEATVPIFETYNEKYKDVYEKLNLCLGEKLEDIYGYPRNVCEMCYLMINDLAAFKKKYKESCTVLKKKVSVGIKQELMDFEIDTDFGDSKCDNQFIELQINNIKKESKIIFNDAHQFEKLVKPLINNVKKEPKSRITKNIKTKKTNCESKKKKAETDHKTNIQKEKVKKSLQKPRINSILSSILEGEFVFRGDKWCIKSSENWHTSKEDVENATKVSNTKKEESKTIEKSLPIVPEPCLCDFCGETFNSKDKLTNHIKTRHLGILAKCTICSKTLTDKHSLKRHIFLVHGNNEKKFICTVCGKAFIFQSVLNKHHKQVHLKQMKKHECNICGKLYSTAKCVLMHVRSVHTGERPAVCTICDSRFTHDDYLKEHMRLHTGETPYKCPVCGRGYAQRCNMKSHIKHVHKLSQLDELQRKTVHPRYLRLMKP